MIHAANANPSRPPLPQSFVDRGALTPLRDFLEDDHFPMTMHRLIEHEKEDVLEYFQSLRSERAIRTDRSRFWMFISPDNLPSSVQWIVRRGSVAPFMVTMLAALGFPAQAQDPHLGITEYEISCMPCHGIDGRGDGPRAKTLKTVPADLTMITKSHNANSPPRNSLTIDGRAIVGTHGQRDMPVWGDRYRVRTEANEPNSAIDRRARAQILALVEYLRRIQEK
jgi:hypothetical protein